MRVLVACEFSGIVRDAFQGDVRDLVSWLHFDLVIAHPPCTYLANSGVRWLYGGKGTTPDPARWEEMRHAALFMRLLLDLPNVPRVAVENPIMHSYGQAIVGGRPDQILQPWMFGHGETKATCLWLRNLPQLVPTCIVDGRSPRVHHASPGPDRWKERSRTLPGIAAAMAEQWGSLA